MAEAGSFVVTDQQEYSVESPSRPTWNDLHPVLPPRMTQKQALHHYNTKQAIGAMPRNILGIAILRALRMRLPNPPRQARLLTPAMLEESNRRIQQIREELASKGLTPTGRTESQPVIQELPSKVEELRESVARTEAQSTFEAQMRVAELRRNLDS